MDPRLARALVAWLTAREPRLGGRVRPSVEQPGSVGPYLVYTHVSTVRVGNLQHRTGQTATRVQLDVWSQDHALGLSVAYRIKGTGTEDDTTARGLDHFAGTWPDPGGTADVTVQFAECLSDFGDDSSPVLGTETPWYRLSADFEITYEETY